MKAIRVENLGHSYKEQRALDNVNFEVNKGEIFSFLGPNGAGKTTMIKILTGQLRPTDGQAWVAGYNVITQREEVQPRVGIVFEYPNLYERMTAYENLQFNARLYGVSDSRVEKMLNQTGLGDQKRKPVKKFSSGMKQRLLIARALLHQPEVLFLDEPTRGLDVHIAREIREIISALSRSGVTVFLTTHYIEEAEQLSSRVAFINHGKIAAMGEPQKLKKEFGFNEQTRLEDVFVQLTRPESSK